MTTTDLTRRAAALVCTIVMSAACVLGAVAPVQSTAVSSAPTQQVA